MSELIVAKFGGSSLADEAQQQKVVNIVKSDSRRKVVVVSAPGKRYEGDTKVTDLLLKGKIEEALARFPSLAEDKGARSEFETSTGDRLVSRGEWAMAKVMAYKLGFRFVDAALVVRFARDGSFVSDFDHSLMRDVLMSLVVGGGIVVPGFYGALPDGSVKTFSRGGSDITGAFLAAVLNALVYENWTDVPGVLMADPRIVDAPISVEAMTYREMRELAYRGAQVLHEEAVFPVRVKGIPIHIRNTNQPHRRGTRIVPDHSPPVRNKKSILGIASQKSFCAVRLEKALMNQERGFLRKASSVFEEFANVDHVPGGIDTLTFVAAHQELEGKFSELYAKLDEVCAPDEIMLSLGVGLIAIVGEAMTYSVGVLLRIAFALAERGINVSIADQGSSEVSVILGVWEEDCEEAVRAIYREFTDGWLKRFWRRIVFWLKAAL